MLSSQEFKKFIKVKAFNFVAVRFFQICCMDAQGDPAWIFRPILVWIGEAPIATYFNRGLKYRNINGVQVFAMILFKEV